MSGFQKMCGMLWQRDRPVIFGYFLNKGISGSKILDMSLYFFTEDGNICIIEKFMGGL